MRHMLGAALVALATLDPAIGCAAAAAAHAAAPPLRLRLALTPSGPIGPAALAAARREAAALWSPAGVDIVVPAAPADVTLTVLWTRLPRSGSPVEALGAVAFDGDRPAPEIRVWDAGVLTTAVVGSAPWPATPDTIGRVLGRVLAHEIGHYLRAEPGHEPSGLMRAWHSPAEFAARSRRAFSLDGRLPS